MSTENVQAFFFQLTGWAVQALPNLIAAILILVIGFFAANFAARLVRRLLGLRVHIDQTLTPVIATLVRYTILIVVLLAFLQQIGVQVASILAVLGAAGLAIGLALQGTLSNIAAGLMLLWLRPFRAGDSVASDKAAGTVTEVGLFATSLRTRDGVFHFVPNSTLWNTPIKNFTRNATRMVEVVLVVDFTRDLANIRAALLDLAKKDPRVLDEPAPRVVATGLDAANITLAWRCWTNTENYLAVLDELTDGAKQAIVQASVHPIAPPPPSAAPDESHA